MKTILENNNKSFALGIQRNITLVAIDYCSQLDCKIEI